MNDRLMTQVIWVLLIIGAVAAFAACGSFGGDDPNRAEDTSSALSNLAANASDEDVKVAIDDEVGDSSDARKIATAVNNAHGRGVSYTEIAGRLDELGDSDTQKVVSAINAMGKTTAGVPSTTPTPTAISTKSVLTEDRIRQIVKEEAAKAPASSTLTQAQVQKMVDKAMADAIAAFQKNTGLTEADVRKIIGDQLTRMQQAQVAGATASSTPSVVKTIGSMPTFVETASHGAWNIQGTDRLKDNPIVAGWLNRLKDPDPANWKTFPNIPNPDVAAFRVVLCKDLPGNSGVDPTLECVPDGMEYGTYSSPYCFAHPCDIPVGAWEYRYISGDYQFLGTSCKGDMKKGCMLILINVMDQSFTWRNQDVDNGFTLRGRYFNGNALEWGVWGLVSHGSANMLNMETFAHPGEILNAGAPGNSGANCGTPLGCGSVDVTVVVHAGDAIIAVAKTTVTK